MERSLNHCQAGQTYIFSQLEPLWLSQHQVEATALMQQGLVEGTNVTVVKNSWLTPLVIELRGANLSLTKEQARHVLVRD